MSAPVNNTVPPCWWCGAPATTSEHRIKKSDLIREFGKGPYRGDSTLIHFTGGERREVQGPGSQRFRFSRSLCADCNNARSQPFDLAYERFGEFAFANEEEILHTHRISLPRVYGSDWPAAGLDLMRYVAKHIGCRVTDLDPGVGKISMPSGLIAFLDGGPFPDDLEVEIGIDHGWRALHRLATVDPNPETGRRDGVPHLGPVWGVHQLSTGQLLEPQSSFGARWLVFDWRVGSGDGPVNPVADSELRLTTSNRLGWRMRFVFTAARWRREVGRRLRRVA